MKAPSIYRIRDYSTFMRLRVPAFLLTEQMRTPVGMMHMSNEIVYGERLPDGRGKALSEVPKAEASQDVPLYHLSFSERRARNPHLSSTRSCSTLMVTLRLSEKALPFSTLKATLQRWTRSSSGFTTFPVPTPPISQRPLHAARSCASIGDVWQYGRIPRKGGGESWGYSNIDGEQHSFQAVFHLLAAIQHFLPLFYW